MTKSAEKSKALQLRKKGESIKDIAKKLGVSRGSASIWCRDIILTPAQKERLRKKRIKAGHRGRMAGAEMNRRKKLNAIAHAEHEALREVGEISKRDLLVAGAALYWAEGSKTASRCLFINSDPKMVLLMKRFFEEVINIPQKDFKITVQINEIHKPRIKKVLRFWRTLLELPSEQFTNVYYVKTKPKKKYDNHDSYYGIVRLGVRRGAYVQYKILGYIKTLSG